MKAIVALAVVALSLPAWAQAPRPAPQDPEQEKPLTPQEAEKMLQEIYGLMGEAEEGLNNASRGEALRSEQEVVKRIEELLKEMDESAAGQRAILQKIGKLMGGSKGKQQGSIDKINELIRRAGT